MQAALTRALEKWSRVQRTTDPDQYVRRMIVNEHISGLAAGRRRELPVAEVRETAYADPADSVAGSDVVWRVCSGLPRQQRAAVVLRYYEDLEYAEIAALLEVTEVYGPLLRPPRARCDARRARATGAGGWLTTTTWTTSTGWCGPASNAEPARWTRRVPVADRAKGAASAGAAPPGSRSVRRPP